MSRKLVVVIGVLLLLIGLGVIVGENDGASKGRTEAPIEMPALNEDSEPNEVTPLQTALLDGDYGAFLKLLRQGADPNVVGLHGYTVMHLAAQHKNSRYLEKLLDHGGDPNALAVRLRQTPIFNALDSRRPKNRDLLIKRGANIEHEDASGDRPLRHAASIQDSVSVLRFLELGADPTATNKIGATFQSAFFRGDPKIMTWDAVGRRRTVIRMLEERGIPPDPKAERFRRAVGFSA